MPINRLVNRDYYNPEAMTGLLLWQRVMNANEPRKKYVILNGANTIEQTFPNESNAIWSINQYPELMGYGNWLPITLYGISAGGICGWHYTNLDTQGIWTGGSGACYLGSNLMLRTFDDFGQPIRYTLVGWGSPQANSQVFTSSRWAPEGTTQPGTLTDSTGFQFRNVDNVVVDGQTVLAGTTLLGMSRGRSEQIGGYDEEGGRVLITPGSSGLLLKFGPNTTVSQANGLLGLHDVMGGSRRLPQWRFTQNQINPLNQLWLTNTFNHGKTTANSVRLYAIGVIETTLYWSTFGSLTMILGE